MMFPNLYLMSILKIRPLWFLRMYIAKRFHSLFDTREIHKSASLSERSSLSIYSDLVYVNRTLRVSDSVEKSSTHMESLLLPLIIWTIIGASANIILGILARWDRFANSYLHLGALFTWIFLFLQGKLNTYSQLK